MTRIAAIDESRSEARPSEGRALLAELRAQYGETLPDIYAYMAHRPGALRAYSDFVLAVMGGDALPYEYKELAYLKASMGVGCEDCIATHSQHARRVGYSESQIAALGDHEGSPLFSEKERAILRYADHYTRCPGPAPNSLVADLERFFDAAQLVELTLVIAVSSTFGRFGNALGIHSSACELPAASDSES